MVNYTDLQRDTNSIITVQFYLISMIITLFSLFLEYYMNYMEEEIKQSKVELQKFIDELKEKMYLLRQELRDHNQEMSPPTN